MSEQPARQAAATTRLALAIVTLAGYTDAVSYLQFKGVYASFMSGNTTALGIAMVRLNLERAGVLSFIILLFVGGVVAGTRLHQLVQPSATAVLAAVAGVLVLAGTTPLGLWVLVVGMGMLSVALHQAIQSKLTLTYATGTLVLVGAGLADWLGGRGLPVGWGRQVLDWLGLAVGALAGAAAHGWLGPYALVLAAGVALLLALAARRVPSV